MKITRDCKLSAYLLLLVLVGCHHLASESEYPLDKTISQTEEEGLFRHVKDRFSEREKKENSATTINVNKFLWFSSLEVLSFMPLSSTDPLSGVIITDWYRDESTPNERFKFVVYITSYQLRVEALRLSGFKQIRQGNDWVNTQLSPKTVTQLENAILEKARVSYMISGVH